ncbi:MAG: hypothetical protein JWO06_2913 [Bacteroidota bacterium]|nr:hypothetical protein [Bacteroidota bacterium]
MSTQTTFHQSDKRWFDWLEEKATVFLSFEKVAFILLILAYVAPVWIEKYILNTDGPAHTYSAKVLLDYLFGRNLPLYRQYFDLQYFADPNWFSRFWLMFLQVFFSGIVAEKILVSAYLVLFPVLFRKLLVQINPANAVLSFFIFPFLSHRVFNYGFYNYSFAIAFLFGFLWFWKKNAERLHLKNCIVGMLLCTIIYFTHLWGFIFCGLFTTVIIFSDSLVKMKAEPVVEILKDAGIKMLKLFGMMLPGIILSLLFIKTYLLKEDLFVDSAQKLLQAFFKLDVLQIYSYREHLPSRVTAFLVLSLLALSLFLKFRKAKWQKNDAFLLCAIVATLLYFIQPSNLTVGAFWSFRMVLLPYLFFITWSTSVNHCKLVKFAFGGAAIIISAYFLAIRLPYYHRVSQAMEEYVSISNKIPKQSTVLPLCFNYKGNMPDGSDVCPEFWKFNHAFDYACAERDAISFSHNNWIPLMWQADKNPFDKIGMIEGQPPGLDFANYPEKSNGGSVDYVVTWCMDKNYWWTNEWKDMQCQLDSNYTLIDSSTHSLAKLYRVNAILSPIEQ